MKHIFLIFLAGMGLGCTSALQPAKPVHFQKLHARITEVELRMTRDDEARKNRLEETVWQTREIDAIAAERFAFSNAVARVWAEINQELDSLGNTLDITVQGIDYVEKSLAFQQAKLAKAWRDFQFDYDERSRELRSLLCVRKPNSARCASVLPTEERVP